MKAIRQWQTLPGDPWLLVDSVVINTFIDYWYQQAEAGMVIQSLYLGTRQENLGDHAPLLCQDHGDQRILSYLLTHWQDAPWGLALRSAVPVHELIHHLQSFITAFDPQGETVIWRYQDPRLLGPMLNAFEPEDRETFLGPLHALAAPQPGGELRLLHDPERQPGPVCYRAAPWFQLKQTDFDALTGNHRQHPRECNKKAQQPAPLLSRSTA